MPVFGPGMVRRRGTVAVVHNPMCQSTPLQETLAGAAQPCGVEPPSAGQAPEEEHRHAKYLWL
jgi:hypothetical protein